VSVLRDLIPGAIPINMNQFWKVAELWIFRIWIYGYMDIQDMDIQEIYLFWCQ
jgi:hypothetical protein